MKPQFDIVKFRIRRIFNNELIHLQSSRFPDKVPDKATLKAISKLETQIAFFRVEKLKRIIRSNSGSNTKFRDFEDNYQAIADEVLGEHNKESEYTL
jgi:hypothetical protein